MVCRSKQRGEEALEEIKKESGNDVCCFKEKVKIVVYRKTGTDAYATHTLMVLGEGTVKESRTLF